MGSFAAIAAATNDDSVKALALDSVPQNADSMLASTVESRYPVRKRGHCRNSRSWERMPYFFQGCFKRESRATWRRHSRVERFFCSAGLDAAELPGIDAKLANASRRTPSVESKTDLSPSGFSIINASLELSESYDQRVIDFFSQLSARAPPAM